MKGIVFTEFIEMVESAFGLDMADRIISGVHLPSGGAYTSVGTYDHGELVAMVMQLSAATATPPGKLVAAFGEYLFGRFAAGFPRFFVGVGSAFEFLSHVESFIHPEVLKLYPDAMLPRFEAVVVDAQNMVMVYRSSRHFEDLAEGLMIGCSKHFKESIEIVRESIVDADGSTSTRFRLKKVVATAVTQRAA